MAKFKPEKYPVRVTFAFRNEAERNYWLGQLSDGWGENHTGLEWSDGDLYDAEIVWIRLQPEEMAELKRHRRIDRELSELAKGPAPR